jgi:hypothetical protein
MRTTAFVVTVALLFVAIGCTQAEKTSLSGVITTPEQGALTQAPEVTFMTIEDGKQWKLSELYGDVTIVSFAKLEGEACALANPDLMRAAKKELKGEGIPLIEINWPTGECKTPACSVAFHERSYLYTCLVDPDGKARKAFGVGDEDKIFLIGANGKIEKVASAADVKGLIAAATAIQHDKNFQYTQFVY